MSPGDSIADLVFVFMFGKVLKEVRSVLMETEYGWTLGHDENQLKLVREDTQRKKLKRLTQMIVSVSLDMKTLKNCWQLCDTQRKSSVRRRRGMGSKSTLVWRKTEALFSQENWQKQGEK